MSANLVPAWQVSEFNNNLQLLLQQRGSKLRPFVSTEMHKGQKAAPVDQMGSIEAQEVVGRFQEIERTDATTTRRWAYPTKYDSAQLIDNYDRLKIIHDPASKEMLNAVYAFGRKMDSALLTAASGAAYIGEVGTATQALGTASKIAINFEAGGSVGMTVAKLRRALEIFMANNLDFSDPENELYCALPGKQIGSLLKEVQVMSQDFNPGEEPVIRNGTLNKLFRFNFVHTELCNTSATSVTQVIAWAKSGLHLGIWEDIVTDLDKRKDLKTHPWQVYVQMAIGATRLDEQKVIEIACVNT